ncbi:sulfatase [Fulvivirga sedimenti]|uniref:Sulfatase n=1 Tax=Fulvivirga sedimenti TaxID=2879465 RepID=A0A9X1HT01_9BACT|nr:sulfatase [Fulvivirga sedimenti]MCA6075449.1 sulfatase [Fulvivirga sedimenti]MCA6076626.1 sulfatase [Fulvivirga sedimenti]MCA6077754.1 sulfatase [Fulvivirga sedimenti]
MKNFRSFDLICLLIVFLTAAGCSEQSGNAPNIIFILADDFGNHDLGYTGSSFYQTPNLDQLASESMIFTNGYAACQVCSPSRASIMSGKFPARHGITDWIGAPFGEDWRRMNRYNKLLPPDYKHQLDTAYITLPEALREGGYSTFFAGKWHLGSKGSWPTDHGFDHNIGGWDAGSPRGGYFSPYENPNLADGPAGENLSMRLARETVNFIQSHQQSESDKPFFAFLSFYAVHGPIQTTKEKWKKYRDLAVHNGIADHGYEMGKFLPIRQVQDNPVYAGLVEQMDDAIGEVLAALREMNLDENTIVVFTSDNGGVAAGDAYSTSNLPLRAGKGYQYEGGIREPYFIKVPWMNTGGRTSDIPVTGTDFYPTLLELAGLPLRTSEHSDGVSLVNVLKGDSIETRLLIWHYPHYGNQGGEPSSIIRRGDWKLIYYYEDGRTELFDLEKDPGEQSDVSADNPQIVERLLDELFNFLRQVNAKRPVPDPGYSPELEQEHLERVKNEVLPRLEQQRLQFLSEDFDPNNDWWGSAVKD